MVLLTKNMILRQVDPSDILRNHLIFFENNPIRYIYIYKYIYIFKYMYAIQLTCNNKNWIFSRR